MHFNIRVYGVLINDKRQVLVCDEIIRNNYYTKFPGGGLEYGEGTRDCLAREFLEEMDLKVQVTDHIYTTDFFQLSAFHPDHQIISIYYRVEPKEEIKTLITDKEFDFIEAVNGAESFRFIEWDDLSEDSVTLPIDRIVVKMIKSM